VWCGLDELKLTRKASVSQRKERDISLMNKYKKIVEYDWSYFTEKSQTRADIILCISLFPIPLLFSLYYLIVIIRKRKVHYIKIK